MTLFLEWAALFVLGGGVCVIHSMRFTSGATPAEFLAAESFYDVVGNYWFEMVLIDRVNMLCK